jgi:HK97 family phage prohead protease
MNAQRDAGPEYFRTPLGVAAKGVDVEKRTVRVVASTADVDSYGEIVEQDWDLERYKRTPVVLYNHNSAGGWMSGCSAMESLPIGKATDVAIVDGQLEATLKFSTAAANPMAELVFQQFVEGSMTAVSVGFMPDEVRQEKRNGVDVVVLSKNELFEISATPMGANPYAVAKGASPNAALIQKRLGAKAPEAPKASEKTMTELEQAKADLAAKAALLAERDAELANLKKLATEATTEHEETKKALEVEKTERKKAEKAAIALEVDALVGKKIFPAEKDEFVELRADNPALFAKMIAKRPDLTLGKSVVKDGTDQPENTATEGGGASERLAKAAKGS